MTLNTEHPSRRLPVLRATVSTAGTWWHSSWLLFDLMSADQIRSYAETIGVELPHADDHKVLIKTIRRQLLR